MPELAAIPASREDQAGTLQLTQPTPHRQEPPGKNPGTRTWHPSPEAGTPAAALTARRADSRDLMMRPPPARQATRSAIRIRHLWRCPQPTPAGDSRLVIGLALGEVRGPPPGVRIRFQMPPM